MLKNEYKIVEYYVCDIKTWVVVDNHGETWFPLSEIFKNLFKVGFNVSSINKKQANNTIRIRIVTPRKKLSNVAPDKQPRDVIIFGNLWCIKNLIRSRIKMEQDPMTKGRDFIVESFGKHWNFKTIGYGVITTRTPNWKAYPLYESIAIAGEENKTTWMRCVECEKYYPATKRFYKTGNVTCERCLGREFRISSTTACSRIEELVKKRGKI